MDAHSLLTEDDRATLATAEAVIESGLKTFCQVGRALAQVRDERLYRATHETFEDYCRERWDMARASAYQFIDAAAVTSNLSANGGQILPDSERVTRPLTSLPPEEQSPAWERAVHSAGGKQPTAKQVKQAVAKVTGRPAPPTVVRSDAPACEDESQEPYEPEHGTPRDALASIRFETPGEDVKAGKPEAIHDWPSKTIPANLRGEFVKDVAHLEGRKFGCIYVDPPWKFSNQSTRGSTDNHYETMTVDELCALPVRELAANKCHLHLWTVNAFLFDCPRIFEAWGFEFKSSFAWVKPQMGMGNYWRNSHELLLLGVRGGLVAESKGEMSWLQARRERHSVKPEGVRQRIERLSPGPYLEMFGRSTYTGWTVYGNEIIERAVDLAI